MEIDNTQSSAKQFYHQRVIVDASILLKVFFTKEDDELVLELLKMHDARDTTLLAPPLITYEVMNVIAKSQKSSDEAKIAFQIFEDLSIGMIDPDYPHFNSALKNATEQKELSFYDSIYHGLAKYFDCTLLTADKKFYNAVKKQGNIALVK